MGNYSPDDFTAHWARRDLGEVVVSAKEVHDRVLELGRQITLDYADNPPLLVCVLKGAINFMSDLMRAVELPVEVDFMAVSSYGAATKTSGVVRIVKDLDVDLAGRDVLIVEDVVDSGLTLNYLRQYLGARNPASLEVCALLLKEGEQRVQQSLRYVGFAIPADFVVGYGLDVNEKYRNLDAIYTYVGGA
ncbi:MAG: hypoxanthine phosphoribosyltransferase [Acidobacteriota bacterium]|nr:hypoxanthine phosphoribosyltransferase [Acidobacteriota bacterium]MDE3043852.1 hypoxanthine phosphoribosyltransferase [Acidobacteriota bacterium]MDE3106917.1 hypoxanthine phosphoribosyltransferase [Acidobacteriota bacterium]MDE3223302.1 hypoxanthine phosphoribosyltransferase [Acidobacteriota bacterium]